MRRVSQIKRKWGGFDVVRLALSILVALVLSVCVAGVMHSAGWCNGVKTTGKMPVPPEPTAVTTEPGTQPWDKPLNTTNTTADAGDTVMGPSVGPDGRITWPAGSRSFDVPVTHPLVFERTTGKMPVPPERITGITLTPEEYEQFKQLLRLQGATAWQVGLVNAAVKGGTLLLVGLCWIGFLWFLRRNWNYWFDQDIYKKTWPSVAICTVLLICTALLLYGVVS